MSKSVTSHPNVTLLLVVVVAMTTTTQGYNLLPRRGGFSYQKTDKKALYVRMLGDMKTQTKPELMRDCDITKVRAVKHNPSNKVHSPAEKVHKHSPTDKVHLPSSADTVHMHSLADKIHLQLSANKVHAHPSSTAAAGACGAPFEGAMAACNGLTVDQDKDDDDDDHDDDDDDDNDVTSSVVCRYPGEGRRGGERGNARDEGSLEMGEGMLARVWAGWCGRSSAWRDIRRGSLGDEEVAKRKKAQSIRGKEMSSLSDTIYFKQAKNPYHNSMHAADVVQAMHCNLREDKISRYLHPVEKMTAILSAAGHDLYHPGVNQAFLISTQNPLATLYKNSSILENHHLQSLIAVINESRLFDHLSTNLWLDVKRLIKTMILATDITKQHEILAMFRDHLNNGSLNLQCNQQHRTFILQICLKCADICNPCRPWSLSQRWSELICQEFFGQGDRERLLSLPVATQCDRNITTVAKIQTGFMTFIVEPLFTEWSRYAHNGYTSLMLYNLKENKDMWNSFIAGSDSPVTTPTPALRACHDSSQTTLTLGACGDPPTNVSSSAITPAALCSRVQMGLSDDEIDMSQTCRTLLQENINHGGCHVNSALQLDENECDNKENTDPEISFLYVPIKNFIFDKASKNQHYRRYSLPMDKPINGNDNVIQPIKSCDKNDSQLKIENMNTTNYLRRASLPSNLLIPPQKSCRRSISSSGDDNVTKSGCIRCSLQESNVLTTQINNNCLAAPVNGWSQWSRQTQLTSLAECSPGVSVNGTQFNFNQMYEPDITIRRCSLNDADDSSVLLNQFNDTNYRNIQRRHSELAQGTLWCQDMAANHATALDSSNQNCFSPSHGACMPNASGGCVHHEFMLYNSTGTSSLTSCLPECKFAQLRKCSFKCSISDSSHSTPGTQGCNGINGGSYCRPSGLLSSNYCINNVRHNISSCSQLSRPELGVLSCRRRSSPTTAVPISVTTSCSSPGAGKFKLTNRKRSSSLVTPLLSSPVQPLSEEGNGRANTAVQQQQQFGLQLLKRLSLSPGDAAADTAFVKQTRYCNMTGKGLSAEEITAGERFKQHRAAAPRINLVKHCVTMVTTSTDGEVVPLLTEFI